MIVWRCITTVGLVGWNKSCECAEGSALGRCGSSYQYRRAWKSRSRSGENIENLTFRDIDILEQDEDDYPYQGCMAVVCGDKNMASKYSI